MVIRTTMNYAWSGMEQNDQEQRPIAVLVSVLR